MNRFKLHSSNITYLVICVLGVLAFCLVGIWPNSVAIKDAEEEIGLLNQKVQTQELLYPVYRELIKEATQKTPSTLPIPKKNEILLNDLSHINKTFFKLAQENQVTFNSAVPDVSSYLEDTGHLTMNLDFSGDFFQLRGLLLSICQLPYLESIETMKIETAEEGKRIRFKLKFVQGTQ
jgi:hypothetical protein